MVADLLRRRGWTVGETDMSDQRRGRDLNVVSPGGERASVEVKTDFRAADTSRVFVELETNGAGPGSGWAYTCTATWLIVYVPGTATLYLVRPASLLAALDGWVRAARRRRNGFAMRGAQNRAYTTLGVCVPIDRFAAVCTSTMQLDDCALGAA